MRYARTATLVLVATLLLLPLCGLTYQWAATRRDEQRYPMPGRWVEVEHHRVHLDCRGMGSPTVLLDAGLGDSSATWALVQPAGSKVYPRLLLRPAGAGLERSLLRAPG